MKTKIIFTLRNFERGGIPRVLINLCEALDSDRFDISIFCGNCHGMFLSKLPKKIKLLREDVFLKAIICDLNRERFLNRLFPASVKLLRKILQKIFKFDLLDSINRKIARRIAEMDFDVAWACEEGLPGVWISQCRGKKFIWLHNDYRFNFARGDLLSPTDFSRFDKIICVAAHNARAFGEKYPQFADKCEVLYNIINAREISELSTRSPDDRYFNTSRFSLISIGRFSPEKQFELIPGIARKLLDNGYDFCWYIIGGGGKIETSRLQQKIAESQVQEQVILLGEKSNPYQYLAKCQLLALTSRFESYPTVINEAKILQIPVLSTRFNGVEEILPDNCGITADIEDFATVIAELIDHPERLADLHRNPVDFNAHNADVLKKFQLLTAAEK